MVAKLRAEDGALNVVLLFGATVVILSDLELIAGQDVTFETLNDEPVAMRVDLRRSAQVLPRTCRRTATHPWQTKRAGRSLTPCRFYT